ncbi:hypothetical protein [Rhodococcus opacus]
MTVARDDGSTRTVHPRHVVVAGQSRHYSKCPAVRIKAQQEGVRPIR